MLAIGLLGFPCASANTDSDSNTSRSLLIHASHRKNLQTQIGPQSPCFGELKSKSALNVIQCVLEYRDIEE